MHELVNGSVATISPPGASNLDLFRRPLETVASCFGGCPRVDRGVASVEKMSERSMLKRWLIALCAAIVAALVITAIASRALRRARSGVMKRQRSGRRAPASTSTRFHGIILRNPTTTRRASSLSVVGDQGAPAHTTPKRVTFCGNLSRGDRNGRGPHARAASWHSSVCPESQQELLEHGRHVR